MTSDRSEDARPTWGIYRGGTRICGVPAIAPRLCACLIVAPYALRLLIEPFAMAWRLHWCPARLGRPYCWYVHVPGDEPVFRRVRTLGEYLVVTACLPEDARHEVVGLPIGRVYDLTPESEAAP